ncbi:winged helix-turn-helix transcriptional regulator [Nocardioides speluncae]|uniref:winged helix-turn-helix transcriptional regulator n=1 Tax=Nocardioides speluncae TaxID=2670337 RepID=UPI000D6954C7|nr:helix-turn-helix domain-containing protein [Nocardioides speluncae]
MLGKTYDAQVCSAARALELVGERWSLLIVRDALFAGSTRFNDFSRLGIATNILASRLDGFVEAGIMERRPYSDNAELLEYVLTEKGRELAAVIVALTAWGDRWVAPDGPPVSYTHTVCRGPIASRLTCAQCGDIDDAREIYVRPGPGMPEDLAARVRSREP